MALPGHDHDRGPTHGVITGNNTMVTGGDFRISVQNVYSSPPPSPLPNHQVLVLKILCSKMDGRLLHNSKAYEAFQTSSQNPEVDSYFEKLTDDSANNPILRHGSYHPFRGNYSRALALSVARWLAGHDALLASIILPSSSQSCAKDIVPTLAYQLAQRIPPAAEYILAAIQHDPGIFELDTETQFTQLIERPLKLASQQLSPEELAKWPSIIVVDGNASQFSPGSVPQKVIQFLGNLSAKDSLGIRISLVLTSSTTLVDKSKVIMLALQQSAGGPACYFIWRIHG
ncbi:hypothetical protein D9619_006525 [Psilocybe cf. subviscida]|uniref:Uncharacterized protein n=1 Tax=Psilocybe cf. subviscida TaxID=2480587 RepID=A0A8H5EY77_9AGAR|nr:hypothetical protein D9619_006525 [Psilocybe cf. subviscida]